MSKTLPLILVLLLSLGAFAQTTTTYNLAAINNSTAIARRFSIEVSDGTNMAVINWLQQGSTSACATQTAPFFGFVFVTLPTQPESPCIPLKTAASSFTRVTNTSGTFTLSGSWAADDANNVPYTATYSGVGTYAMKCGGGRGGGCHEVYTLTGFTLAVTE
jgi:hypothetical protein